MKHALCSVSLSTLLLTGSALAQEEWRGPDVSRTHGLTSLTFEGPGEGAASARLRRADDPNGARAALVLSAAGGESLATLRTPRLLLEGDYVLEVLGADQRVVARRAFRLGSEDEVAAAAEAMRRWHSDAASDLRELASGLERHGVYFHGRMRADPESADPCRERFARFLEGWRRRLLRRRMDHVTYRRRLLLPPRRTLGDDLLRLPDLLTTRARLWREALAEGRSLGPHGALEALAERVRAALGEDAGSLSAWRAGPLAAMPSAPRPGTTYVSPLGFRLAIPADADIRIGDTPDVRLRSSYAGAIVLVTARDLPDERTRAARKRRLEVIAWETWQGYRQLSSRPTADEGAGEGLRLEFTARLSDPVRGPSRMRAIQRTLFAPGSSVAVSLLIFRPEDAPPSAALEALERAFQVAE